jgi:predicted membrane-bound spermidine synthase
VTANYKLLVFLTAFSTLMFELVASRLADFHLGAGNAYLAIPITFLGLALGSLHVHSRPGIIERFDPGRAAAVLAALCLLSLLTLSAVFSRLLPVVSALQETSNRSYLFHKTLTFIVLLLPPFYFFGRILTVAYQLRRTEIGAVYSADLCGAALACAVTPVLFHFGGLPNVSLVLLGLTFIPVLVFFRGSGARRALVGLLLVAVCIAGRWTMAHLDRSIDYSRYDKVAPQFEIAHGWNEHSRVAVLAQRHGGKNKEYTSYRIVHDNSRSNVNVLTYRKTMVGRPPSQLEAIEVAAILERPVKSALVMFAGCGAEMIQLNELFGGKARITGVELNPLVRDLALETPPLRRHKLREFYDLPQIELVIDEGRHFLSTTKDEYDLIFIGSNADTAVWLSGHSRKYLDTTQAFHLFVERLTDRGLIVFDHQPVDRRIETMKQVFLERGVPEFEKRVVILESLWSSDDMVISPSGFSAGEVRRLVAAAKDKPQRVLYAPGRKGTYYAGAIERPVRSEAVMTDDRPFLVGLDWRGYALFPRKHYLDDYQLYVGWIKITTLVVLIAISLLFIALIALRRSASLPPAVLTYLLMTGFCFMLVEIALIAKLELFLQKPIVSMAMVLSTFLLASGIGSSLFPRFGKRLHVGLLALAAATLSAAAIFVLELFNSRLLGLPMGLKLLASFVVTAPVGLCLGLFYPYAVSCLVKHERSRTVAITYGISTLSSVIGATYGLTVMLDWGFSRLLWQAAVGYVLLAGFFEVYARVFRGRFLTL